MRLRYEQKYILKALNLPEKAQEVISRLSSTDQKDMLCPPVNLCFTVINGDLKRIWTYDSLLCTLKSYEHESFSFLHHKTLQIKSNLYAFASKPLVVYVYENIAKHETGQHTIRTLAKADYREYFTLAGFKDELIYITGGSYDRLGATQTVQAFNLATNNFDSVPDMIEARYNHSATTTSNALFVFGGWSGMDRIATIERLCLTEKSAWETIRSESFTAKEHATVCTISDREILICGGLN